MTTLPPIGKSDHDIVYIEIDTWLRRVRETPRKIYKFNSANWENIASDLQTTFETLKQNNDNNVDSLWNTFKVNLIASIEQNIPTKKNTDYHMGHKQLKKTHKQEKQGIQQQKTKPTQIQRTQEACTERTQNSLLAIHRENDIRHPSE